MHHFPDHIQFFINLLFRLKDGLISHHDIRNGLLSRVGKPNQIACRLVRIGDLSLRRFRVLFQNLRQFGMLLLASDHKAPADGVKTSLVEKFITGICRKVHGIGVERSDLISGKGNVPFRIERYGELAIED